MFCVIDSEQKYKIIANLLELFVNFDLGLSEIFILFGLV
jgi:hypothetical protein